MSQTLFCLIENCNRIAILKKETETHEWGLCSLHVEEYKRLKDEHDKGIKHEGIDQSKIKVRHKKEPWRWPDQPFHWTTFEGEVLPLSALPLEELVSALQTIAIMLGSGTPTIPKDKPKMLEILQKPRTYVYPADNWPRSKKLWKEKLDELYGEYIIR